MKMSNLTSLNRVALPFLWLILIVEGCAIIWLQRPWIFGDNDHYLVLAQSLDLGRYGANGISGFEFDVIRPPGYPIFLWVFVHKLHLPIVGVVILQFLAYLASIFMIGEFLKRRGVSSTILLFLAVIYPFPLIYGLQVSAEAWAMFCITACGLLLAFHERRIWVYIALGAFAGTAIYLRSDLLLTPFVITGWIFWEDRERGAPLGKSIFHSILPVAVATAMLIPYVEWNRLHFGKASPVPIASSVGPSLYLATWQEKLPNEDLTALYDGVVTKRAEASGLAGEVRYLNGSLGAPSLQAPWVPGNYSTNSTRIRATKLMGALARQRIQNDPGAYADHVIRNVWRLWHSTNYPKNMPPVSTFFLKLSSAIVLIFGAIGILFSFIRPSGWPISAGPALLLLSLPAIHVWLHTEARYTAAVRPLLLLFAAIAIHWLWCRTRSHTWQMNIPFFQNTQ